MSQRRLNNTSSLHNFKFTRIGENDMGFWFFNVNVIDVKKGTVIKNANVKVSGGKIAEITSTLPADTGEGIDMGGKYLMPGIIDTHVHLVWEGTSADPMSDTVRDSNYVNFAKGVASAQKSLKAGVTTVRDVGSCDDTAIPLASAINRGIIEGCNIVPCGGAIQGSYGHCPMIGTIANTSVELVKLIKELKGYNIEMRIPPTHWIKIMASGGAAGLEDVGPCMYSPEELNCITYEAHRLNMKVAAHALSYDSISKCVDAGIDTIEHGADMTEAILEKMKAGGQTWVPTLAVYKDLSESRGIIADIIVDKATAVTEKQKKAFKIAVKIGARIALGTDAGSPNFGPHPSAFKEMKVMNEFGMPVSEVIKCSTITAAEVLGIGEKIGSVENGKIADLIVLDKNPLEDLSAFDEVSAVYKAGELIK